MKELYIERNISVSTYDIDFAGHVSNIVYLRWLEDMRLQMFDEYCPLQNFIEKGITPILLSTKIDYLKSIKLFDKPLGKMWVSAFTKTTFTVEGQIFLNETLCTKASHLGVFVNIEKMKPIKLPSDFMEIIKCAVS